MVLYLLYLNKMYLYAWIYTTALLLFLYIYLGESPSNPFPTSEGIRYITVKQALIHLLSGSEEKAFTKLSRT